MSCPCPARSRVQQLCTVRYKATAEGLCVRTVQKMQNEVSVWNIEIKNKSDTTNDFYDLNRKSSVRRLHSIDAQV